MNLRRYFIDAERCIRCNRCIAICPRQAIKPTAAGTLQIQHTKCRRCGTCQRICKQRAITSRVRLWFE